MSLKSRISVINHTDGRVCRCAVVKFTGIFFKTIKNTRIRLRTAPDYLSYKPSEHPFCPELPESPSCGERTPMRRSSLFALAGLMASFLVAGSASACWHKKACAPAPCAAPVVACEQSVPCAPVCAPAPKKCFHMPKICMPKIKLPKLGCHKAACAPACSTCETTYAAPQTWAAPQTHAASQVLGVPQK